MEDLMPFDPKIEIQRQANPVSVYKVFDKSTLMKVFCFSKNFH